MPRLLVDISEAWLVRYQTGVVQVIDTLTGIESQITQTQTESSQDAYDLLDQIQNQLIDLRRNVESWRIMF